MNTIRGEHAVAPVTRTRRFLAAAAIGALLLLPLTAGATTINFDSGTNGNAIGNDFAGLGIHFGSAYTYYNDNAAGGTFGDYPASSNPNSAYGPAGPGTTITFDSPVTSFSFFFNNGICSLCDQPLAVNVPNGPTFASYSAGPPITAIRFFAGDITLDDFTFETAKVPEPASLLLLSAGLAAVARHHLLGVIPVGSIFSGSMKVGERIRRRRLVESHA